MEVTPVGQPTTLAAADEGSAAAEEAFTQAIGTTIFSAAMNVVGALGEQLAELEKEE